MNAWYENKVGEFFKLLRETENSYWVKDSTSKLGFRLILKKDAEVYD